MVLSVVVTVRRRRFLIAASISQEIIQKLPNYDRVSVIFNIFLDFDIGAHRIPWKVGIAALVEDASAAVLPM